MQRPEPGASGQEPIRPFGLCQRHRVGHRREAEQRGVVPADAVEVDARESDGSELPTGDPGGQVPHGRKGDVLVRWGSVGAMRGMFIRIARAW